jgi:hypothetical protein
MTKYAWTKMRGPAACRLAWDPQQYYGRKFISGAASRLRRRKGTQAVSTISKYQKCLLLDAKGPDDYQISTVIICWPAHSGTYRTNTLYVRSHSKVPFVTDFDHASKPWESQGLDAQYEGYIIFVAAHAAPRAKYEALSNMPLVLQ